ncbi:unnamed protein product [Blepharisma stoltei]|uniref:Palmitoyltransferase n=1 Tax=Blepharisma stoltei TaxID=1481888 RepID=A0AAU9IH08_9CILI|nr:unnamed protein product [Blepharisma stoltei]
MEDDSELKKLLNTDEEENHEAKVSMREEPVEIPERYLPPWSEADNKQKIAIIYYKIGASLPIASTLGTILCSYILYIWLYIYYLVGDTDDRPELYFWHSESEKENAKLRGWICFSLFTLWFLIILISYFQAYKTDPGTIPPDWQVPAELKKDTNLERIGLVEKRHDGKARICKWCNLCKPDRCHHCKFCGRCVLKLHHHCEWIPNCIGYFNYKYFFLMMLYGELSAILIVATFWETVVVVLNDSESSTFLCFLVVFGYTMACLFSLSAAIFLAINIKIIKGNYTWLEFWEKKWFAPKLKKFEVSPYDRGIYNNLKEALGQKWYWWLLPFYYREEGETGLFFRISEEVQTAECSICMTPLYTKETSLENVEMWAPVQTSCNHTFHNNCIVEWSKLKRQCPICRSSLDWIIA